VSTQSKIEWTDTTWNPLAGCTPVSPGCRNCYAANHARRLAGHPNPKVGGPYAGTARTAGDGRAVFTGQVNLLEDRLTQPLRWRKPRRVFVNAMSDLFHPDVPDDFVDKVFAVMALCPQHTFQVLTKRPERMAEWALLNSTGGHVFHVASTMGSPRSGIWPLPNVWLGTSVEDQARADERIPHLLRCPAAVRFLSCEPLLGPVDVSPYLDGAWANGDAYPSGPRVNWIIPGGESGPGARPCNVEWVRSLVRQCSDAGVACFVKQLGARPRSSCDHFGVTQTDVGGWWEHLLRDHKGGDMEEWPEDLRVREYPQEPSDD